MSNAMSGTIGGTSVNPATAFDLAIIGAGPVGMALAAALARRSATAALSILLIDSRDASAASSDPRVMALSHGSRVLLTPLGWPEDITPIERIHVSQRGHFGRALIDRHEHGLDALGYVVRYGVLCKRLREGLDRAIAAGAKITLLERHTVQRVSQNADGVTLEVVAAGNGAANAGNTTDTQTGAALAGTLHTRLLIHAEGGLFARTPASDTVEGTAVSAVAASAVRDYQQTAIVGAVRCTAVQARTAWERFTSEGPIALLPLHGSAPGQRRADVTSGAETDSADYALVWCQSPDAATRRMSLGDAAFLRELDAAFGERVGRFTTITGRAMFPLGLNHRRSPVDGRTAAIGNAAQTLHPVAGQGLNLGLRDAEALASALATHGATPAALTDFAAKRRFDRTITIGLTDLLARGFTVDFAPLAFARGLALAALDVMPWTKSVLARQMMFGQRR